MLLFRRSPLSTGTVVSRLSRTVVVEWSASAFAAVAGVVGRVLIEPNVGDSLPFVFAAPIAVFCSMVWGAGPGALSAMIGLIAALLPQIPPNVLSSDGFSSVAVYSVSMALLYFVVARLGTLRGAGRQSDAPDTPLVKWLNAVLIAAVLTPATAFVLIAWWSFDRAESAALAAASRRANLAYEHAMRTFQVAEQLTLQAADLTAGDDAAVRASEPELRQRLSDMLLGSPSVVNLNVWDADAKPLVRSDRIVDVSATVADRSYFQEQKEGNFGFGLSPVLVGRQTGRELMNLTMRRPSANGVFRGAVALSLSPSYFTDYYRAIVADSAEAESVALIRIGGGEILARWPPQPSGWKRLPSDAPTLTRVRAGEMSGVLTAFLPGTKEMRIVGFRRLPGLPIYVLVGFSRAAMLAGWVRTVQVLAAVILPITLVLVAVTALARRRVRLEQETHARLTAEVRLRGLSENAALEANRKETLAALTGGVAHDFNNLLAVLTNSLNIHEVRHPEERSESQLASMRRAIQSGVRLTRQLLSFTRKQALQPEYLELRDWLPAAEEMLRTTLGPQIQFSCSVDADVKGIFADPAELELALINLAMNAKHAQPRGGMFRLSASNSNAKNGSGPPTVTISAADRGHGIAKEHLDKVTVAFFTTKERGAGSGLGLSQVQGLMLHAAGELNIQSEVGVGTNIELVFPAHDSNTAAAQDVAPAELIRLHGHVLLVEDNDDVAAVTAGLLESMGVKVTHAGDIACALEALQRGGDSIGLVLSDIAMPGDLDGIQFALKLRAERPTLPVTLVTGYSDNIGAAAGAGLDVLQKPISLAQLRARLSAAFPAR